MNWKQPKVYAVKHKNEATRAASRSGGIFTALSDQVLSIGGVIYGCVLTDDFNAVHIRADNEEDRNRMRGSKYIQSKLGNTFKSVRADLDAQKSVLFSGTSCQVAGLKKYLGKEYDNLFCVDIVCHGVPSKKVWDAYLRWQEQKNHSKISSVDFRNKKDFGWHDHVETLYFENGKSTSSRVFKEFFYGHTVLRPSCYECPYKSVMHPGDITIADWKGIRNTVSEVWNFRRLSRKPRKITRMILTESGNLSKHGWKKMMKLNFGPPLRISYTQSGAKRTATLRKTRRTSKMLLVCILQWLGNDQKAVAAKRR